MILLADPKGRGGVLPLPPKGSLPRCLSPPHFHAARARGGKRVPFGGNRDRLVPTEGVRIELINLAKQINKAI